MNGYVLSVIGTVLLCAILTAIIPEGKTASVIKGIAKLACVVAIVAPVLRFFQSNGNTENSGIFSKSVIESDETFIKYYSEKRIEETEDALEKELREKYDAETEVTLSWQTITELYAKQYPWEKIQITKIHIRNEEEQTEEVKNAMWEYVTKNYCSEVLIE